ncbi:MAG: 4-hydroxythreonine-4-phosphate dehydrogenase PdxA [Verrucomicrobiales bacterium]|nr:4-hydroxythreonine-4-phosphate dehydrogenase PdxA [Verrucomicrobiales bacterium]
MLKPKPRIAITMGDPAGVGPEVCLHLMARKDVREFCEPIIYGDLAVLDAVAEKTGLPNVDLKGVRNFEAIRLNEFEPGTVNSFTGNAGYTYVREAIEAALEGEIEGVATAPLNKEALHAAGIRFPGHTEIFAAKTGTDRFCMLQYSSIISCSFVTTHCGYIEVPTLMTIERIEEVIDLTREAFLRIRKKEPKMVVLGLNPHSGEHGLFGCKEEEEKIIPAMEICREKGCDLEGPLPPDTAFLKWRLETTDCFICMYHDQGHIPVKALAFDMAVNTTLGLPFPRTSVDHGTALDIAWQGKANPSSLFEAVKLNAKLANREL